MALPATGEFDWSIRNNTNYGETGVLTALQYTSSFPKIILENFYIKTKNSIATGRKETVAGYVIPSGQRDMLPPGAAGRRAERELLLALPVR